jgi:hypothetical protein
MMLPLLVKQEQTNQTPQVPSHIAQTPAQGGQCI